MPGFGWAAEQSGGLAPNMHSLATAAVSRVSGRPSWMGPGPPPPPAAPAPWASAQTRPPPPPDRCPGPAPTSLYPRAAPILLRASPIGLHSSARPASWHRGARSWLGPCLRPDACRELTPVWFFFFIDSTLGVPPALPPAPHRFSASAAGYVSAGKPAKGFLAPATCYHPWKI